MIVIERSLCQNVRLDETNRMSYRTFILDCYSLSYIKITLNFKNINNYVNNDPKWTCYSLLDSSHRDEHFGIKIVRLQSLVLEIFKNMKKDVFTKYLENQWLKSNVLCAKMFVSSRRVERAIKRSFSMITRFWLNRTELNWTFWTELELSSKFGSVQLTEPNWTWTQTHGFRTEPNRTLFFIEPNLNLPKVQFGSVH